MKRVLFAALLGLSLAACQKDQQPDPQPDYLPSETSDWYILRAPDDRAIEAVAGDIDGTLTITTRYKIYLTQDRGKTWTTGDYNNNTGLGGLLQKQDTLLAMGATTNGGSFDAKDFRKYAVNPFKFSLNQGLTWFNYAERYSYANRIEAPLNRLVATTGTEYLIEYLLTEVSPGSGSSYVETIGIETSAGRHIKLPQEHQLTSIYFDARSRLYVTASAPLCGTGKNFKFCGSEKGALYISKQPLL